MHDAKRIQSLIAQEVDSLIAFRRELHQHPEIGYQEHETAKRIQRELAAIGVQHVGGLAGGTGTIAHIPGGKPGAKAIGLRADIDALPMHEHGERAWKSRVEGCAHACGHDGHTAIVLGAARVLQTLSKEHPLPNPVTLLFQPAEEGGNGADRMVKEGCLDGRVLGPAIEQMYGLHGWPSFPLGVVASRTGPMLAAADAFEITVHGAGGHAAWPHLAKDPILTACAIVEALQSIVSRDVAPLDAAVVTVAAMHAGEAFNVIPDTALLRGTTRSFRQPVQEMLHRRIRECAEHTARARGLRADVRFFANTPVTINEPQAVKRFERVAIATFGADRVRDFGDPVMGAEDFSFYGASARTCFFALGLDDPTLRCPPLHDPHFDFHDRAIATGVEAMVHLALAEA
jgi:amidohydrolase